MPQAKRLSNGNRISRRDRLRAAGHRPDANRLFPARQRLEQTDERFGNKRLIGCKQSRRR